jgi:cation/acetate symporter
MNFIDTVNEATYIADGENYEDRAAAILDNGGKPVPEWYKDWETTGLLKYDDLNGDGIMQYRGPAAPDGLKNEVVPNRDIFVLANPQIANLPGWVIGLVVAGGLAAALSTAAGLLMVISSAISHDLLKSTFYPKMSEKGELRAARLSAFAAVVAAAFIGAFASALPFVAQVVAFAFGIAAASLFPIIVLGIFWKRMNKEGAIASMLTGLITTVAYISYFKFMGGTEMSWWFGVSPEGIGFIVMWLAMAVGIMVSLVTAPPPSAIQQLVEDIRIPGQRGALHE